MRYSFGPVQSRFGSAELNSGTKLNKSMTGAQPLNQAFELSSTSSVVLHNSGMAMIQT